MTNKKARINLNVDEELRYKVKEISLKQRRSMTELIEELLIDYIKQQEKKDN